MAHLTQPLDAGSQHLAGGEVALRIRGEADSGRGPGEDQVARVERDDLGELCDQFGYGEDQVGGRALLDLFSGFSSSSGVTTQGPIGPKPGCDLARLNCGAGPAS